MSESISRKQFLKNISFAGAAVFGGGVLLSACGGNNKEEQQQQLLKNEGGPCSDVSGLTEDELDTRTSNDYVSSSEYTDKFCGNCNLFILPEGGQACGKCQIIKGPISPTGYCKQWLKKVNLPG